ncbi:histamine N-methyltransferase-like [Acanthaster planci]|uniref:Histamine N-methyltransferase-like n=1 Tax=Acanthaster planci TaxID=133434 RepID=A0A8B7XK37_ACAPL|nr:histamine N-methyltransferase-like [Acanthaster planci]
MEAKSLRSLKCSPDHYARAFKAFRDRCSEVSGIPDWIGTVFSDAVVNKLQVTPEGQEGLRVLGIGSGSGEIDCLMLERFLQRFPRIYNCVVEPVPVMVDQYKSLVQSMAPELQGVHCDWHMTTMQQYQEAGSPTKYHFIGAIHSIYFVNGVDKWMASLYDMLAPGGIMLMVLNSDTSGLCRFQDSLISILGRSKCIMSDAILRSLDRQSIPYALSHQKSLLDITTCFKEDSEDRRLLLDFLTDVVDFQGTAAEEQQRSVLESLASGDCSTRDGEKVWLRTDWDAVFVQKPAKAE